ncbi:Myosin light chain kinase family member 4, partial [Eschrichtius robustus]|nr:Myosin light chain kinase family member 4 [Eschrichtius robustus]
EAWAPPAPFDHRIVTAKQAAVNSFYTVSRTEVLGGGRFGQVHKCEEKATGLKLAAKIIKTRGVKDKDEVKNEINVMNQLDHVNLIQLYDAFESKNDIVLVMEYVDGGELFDRIIDDNYNLTELDTILFTRQICEGIRHMHQMYILHLDLKEFTWEMVSTTTTPIIATTITIITTTITTTITTIMTITIMATITTTTTITIVTTIMTITTTITTTTTTINTTITTTATIMTITTSITIITTTMTTIAIITTIMTITSTTTITPENILCVNRDTKQIKIIDFGLARRYKPREKLKVNFGTPEFLAPEVVNYDFVSFSTDMWSVGVITYMLLSGLSPFLGDNDAETLNNILACRWDLEDEGFQDISEEARGFISKLLIKEKR